MAGYTMSIEGLQKRRDRLFQKADALKDWLNENEIRSFDNKEFIRKWRTVNALYAEASTISICLSAFQQSCYQPLGPLV